MYDRIIVPIEDRDDHGALDHARPFARQLGCELTLLHIHHALGTPDELEGLTQYRYQHVVERWDARDVEVEVEEEEWLSELAAEVAAAEPDLTVTARVVHAPLVRSLHASEDERVLVLASAGAAHLDGLHPTARELLRGGGVPVLLVRPDADWLPVRRIAIALDGSRFSREVVGPALDLAEAIGARLSLVEVVTRHTGLVRLLRPGERSAESAERFLRSVRSEIPESFGPVDVRVVEQGNAAAGLVLEARRGEVGLVAMATHGRGGIVRMILGSVAESVVRRAEVPVLLFRPLASGVAERPVPEVPAG
jgi:nucleotide-binding universal stress UspA family protein